MSKEIVIVSAARTPIGSFLGNLSKVPATKLGAIAIEGALKKIELSPSLVDEVYMGNVLQANLGQAPARQAALLAGISENTPCTTINKVCSSGMKSIMLGAQAIQCGDSEIVVAGGMENMSLAPHYLDGRKPVKFGNINVVDGLLKDGLTNVYDQNHMGVCADLCGREHNISREEQDEFAVNSYKKSQSSIKEGKFTEEIIPVEILQRNKEVIIISEDEEPQKIIFDKVPKLKPAFSKEGTVTAANASTLNDGAAAVILMSLEKAKELNLTPLATIKGYSDAAQEPERFTTTPKLAIDKALKKANHSIVDVDYFELNEAFSVVGIANSKLLNVPLEKVNINGGAVSLGHPLGCSGARIVVSLLHILKQQKSEIGAAGICNGGGGASAIIIENKQID